MWLDYHMNIMDRGRRFIMETPLYYRIAGDDVGPLCEGLLLTDMALGMQDLQHTTLRIKLYEHYGASIDFRTESPHRRLLHHFTRLHSIESFELESPGTERHEYIQQVIDSATADPPSIDAVLADIMATKREAKLLSRSENHAKAVEKYQQALKELLFNNSRFERNKSPSKGKNTGQSYAAIANRLNFKFHCKLVDLHFILHKGEDVYCWAACASGPLFHYSDPDLEIDNLRARLRVLKTRAEHEMNERR
jgi:hypothetical protein